MKRTIEIAFPTFFARIERSSVKYYSELAMESFKLACKIIVIRKINEIGEDNYWLRNWLSGLLRSGVLRGPRGADIAFKY